MVLGAQKAGTTYLFTELCHQPRVVAPFVKEAHHFDERPEAGGSRYRAFFPSTLERRLVVRGGRPITGECTPEYLFFPWIPGALRAVVPDARLVVVLRDPVDRAYSHYWHSRARGEESLEFDEAIAAEDGRLTVDPRSSRDALRAHVRWSYVRRGFYAEQLDRWFRVFPAEQLLVVLSPEMREDPLGTLGRVARHLGADPPARVTTDRRHERDYPPLDAAMRAQLTLRFAADRARLEQLLGRTVPW